jgi:hypothetical protein
VVEEATNRTGDNHSEARHDSDANNNNNSSTTKYNNSNQDNGHEKKAVILEPGVQRRGSATVL